MMDTKYKICAVVVTFNRKDLLINCLNAINEQAYKPHTVIIVDNASTDGTKDLVKQTGYYNILLNGINYQYLLLPDNQGGAGGFYNGIKTAYESKENFDAVWVMDDDGVADKKQLENLVNYLQDYDYIAPLVIAQENSESLAFNYYGNYDVNVLKDKFDKIVPGYSCPFNGILYSRQLIEKIGYPIPQLFIWGDEQNYGLRAKDAGFSPITIIDAIHIHPKDRMTFAKSLFGKPIVNIPNLWKGYCFWRNSIFNMKGRASIKQYLTFYVYNAWYYLIIKKSWTWFSCFNKAYFSGFKKLPDNGYRQYMKG